MNATQISTIQPAAEKKPTRRSPNCQALTLPVVMRAKITADRISPMSWMTVPPICTPVGGLAALTSTPASCAPTEMTVAPAIATTSVSSIAANGAHGGQRGRSARRGDPFETCPRLETGGRSMPDGSSGRSGSGPVGSKEGGLVIGSYEGGYCAGGTSSASAAI